MSLGMLPAGAAGVAVDGLCCQTQGLEVEQSAVLQVSGGRVLLDPPLLGGLVLDNLLQPPIPHCVPLPDSMVPMPARSSLYSRGALSGLVPGVRSIYKLQVPCSPAPGCGDVT